MVVAAATPRKTPQTLLVNWGNTQDAWVRSIVGEALSTRQPLSDSQVDSAYDCMLVEKELNQGRLPNIATLEVSGQSGEAVQTLQLIRLGDIDGVNALRGRQEVIFCQRLTVLFGENAAGKSGYVRVLKRLAAVRSQEEVLPNLLGPARPQKASVKYSLDGKEDECHWKGESGVSPFTRMTAFDTKAAAVHLDADLTFTYTPRDLALFRITHEAIDAVKRKLEDQRKKTLPQGNPFTSFFNRGTSVYAKVETLGPQTDLEELKRLAAVTAVETEQVPDLRERVNALKSQSGELWLAIAKGDLELFKRIQGVSSTLEAIDWSAYRVLLQSLETARRKHEDATVNAFKGFTIPGILSGEWRKFIEAGEAYLRSSAQDLYPLQGSECTYCRQPLEAAAVELIQKYREFTNNQPKQDVTKAEAALAAFNQPIAKLALDSVLSDVKRRADTMSAGAVPTALGRAQSLFENAAPIRDKLVRLESIPASESSSVKDMPLEVTALAKEGVQQAEDLAKALTAEAGERDKLLSELSAQLGELESRIKLNELIASIEEYVNNAKWAARAERVGRGFGGLTRSLTIVSKTASEDLVNQDFERLFKRECKSLRAPKVTLEFPGRDAQPKRRKSLVPKHALSEILSEGEQKVIALADFLAEAAIPQTNAPVIFDDPVNSLDYKRLQYVVDRIVELSAERQVIVFTHNIWFTAELLNRFEKNPGECKYYEVSMEDKVPGTIEALQHPKWDTPARIGKEIKSRLQMAEQQSGVVRDDLVRGAWGQVRSWCEAFIEREVLADVTARYRPHVRMTSLPNIKTALIDATVQTVLPIFEKACRITEAHSQPLETLGLKPDLEDLKEDWATLVAERNKYVS